MAPSPIVDVNRAVALAMAFGHAVGLELIEAIAPSPMLSGYHAPRTRARLSTERVSGQEPRSVRDDRARVASTPQMAWSRYANLA